jgi:hypothetical protein
MAWSYIGAAVGTPAANPTGGNFTVHANTQAGDLVIAHWYSRASGKGFTKPADVNQEIDVATANGGHLFVGWWIAAGSSDSKAWTATSVSNGSTGWGTATFRTGNYIAPFRYKGNTPGGQTTAPDPPEISTASGDALVCGWGHMGDYGTPAAPANFTLVSNWETALGTDASGGMAYDLDGGTGSAVNPATFTGMDENQYWYAWTACLNAEIPVITNPGWAGGGWW